MVAYFSRKWLELLSVLGFLVLLLGYGCGTSSPTPIPTAIPSETPTVSVPTPARPTPTPIAGAKRGGTLNLVANEDPKHFDVHQEVSPALTTWGPGIVYSRLLRFRSGPEVALPSLAVECDLCEGWAQLDPRTYLFRLRPGVRWQYIPPVNGRLLTAQDVVYSYNRQRTQGWPNEGLLRAIDKMEAIDDLTLKIGLFAPDADFLFSLANGHSKIVARESVERKGNLKEGPNIGTGPWVWMSTVPEQGSFFERNTNYFEKGIPFLDKLNINVIKDRPTRLAAFKAGLVDVYQPEPEEWQNLKEGKPSAPVLMYKETGTGLELSINTTRPPFDDLRVRRAVFKAMDPWKAAEDIWLGSAFVSLGTPVAEANWLLPEEGVKKSFQDPDGAKELLRQAGVRVPVKVELSVGDFGDRYLLCGERVSQELRAMGFDVTTKVSNAREFSQNVWYGGKYAMFVGAAPPSAMPNSYLLPVFHSKGAYNTAGYRDKELDRLLEAQASEVDPIVRRNLVMETQRLIIDKAFRFMPATRVSIWTWNPRVKYFHPNFAASEYLHWATMWVND